MEWRSFPLEQVNSQDEDFVFWEQSPDEVRSLRAFLAAEAVREQGNEVLDAFILELLRAVHERKMPVQELSTIEEAATATRGLHVERMLRDMERAELRHHVEDDYRHGVNDHGVFGTPTFLFQGGEAVFVKTSIPPKDDAVSFFQSVQALSQRREYARELKKPRPPERPS